MTGYEIVDGRRYFDADCDHSGHRPGDRHRTPGVPHQEWNGYLWAPVCPKDGVPIEGRDAAGWWCCQKCGLSFRELVELVRDAAS